VMLALLWAMAGSPDAPGLFAQGGPAETWLVRAGGDKDALLASELARDADGRWTAPAADGSRRPSEVHFTVHQATLFFTIYVFFQVWNQINCRSLTPEVSGLRGLWRNPYFLGVASLTVVGQVLIVTFGGRVFDVEPLAWREWLAVAGATASVLVFAELARAVRRAVRGSLS
jgi:Ca2+-transporting ATPase